MEIKAIQLLVIVLVLVSLFASISIASASNPKAKILIDDYHGADLGSTLKTELIDRGFEIEVNSDKTLDSIALGEYDVLVIAIPDKEISETEINAVLNYVDDGGNLVLLGKAGGVIDSMNNLSSNFGIEFNADELCDPTNDQWKDECLWDDEGHVYIHFFASHQLTKKISIFAYWSYHGGRHPYSNYGCTLNIFKSAQSIAWGDEDSYSSIYEPRSCPPVLSISNYGQGELIAHGSYPSWEDAPCGGIRSKDNKQLALNIFHYLTRTTTIQIPTTHIFKEVEAGKSAEYIYTIENLDVMKAKNVKLTVDGQAKNWISFSDNNFDIDGFSSKDVTVTIAPPEGTEVRTYNAEMSVSAENAALYKGEDKTSFLINVKRFNQLPVADAGGDKVVYVDEDVNFDGSSSSDPDGSIVAYEWDFGDGSTGSGEVVTHEYSEKGDYTVILTVTDNDGAKDTDKIFVHVKEGGGIETYETVPLSVKLSADIVALGDDFTISGTSPGRCVEILTISPKGGYGDGIRSNTGTDCSGVTYDKVSLSVDHAFSERLKVEKEADAGIYTVIILNYGRDGKYGLTDRSNIMEALADYGDLCCKEQEQLVSIVKDATIEKAGSDDYLWISNLKIEYPYIELNPIPSVALGENLVVTGISNRKEGTPITITVEGPMKFAPKMDLQQHLIHPAHQ